MKKKEFIYEYPYAKEQLCAKLKYRHGWYHNWDGGEYLIEIKDADRFFLGVARGGHSGGYWYVAKIDESCNEKVRIHGRIVFNPDENGKPQRPLGEILTSCFFFILLFPIILIIKAIELVRDIWFLIKKKPLPRPDAEENLDKFMLDYLGCQRI